VGVGVGGRLRHNVEACRLSALPCSSVTQAALLPGKCNSMSLALVGTSSKVKQTCSRTLWFEMDCLASWHVDTHKHAHLQLELDGLAHGPLDEFVHGHVKTSVSSALPDATKVLSGSVMY
jgi:hypothetical protein